jgi:endoglucanase
MTSEATKKTAGKTMVAVAGGAMLLLGCIIPDKSASQPQVAPGSAASIGGGAPAAAAAPSSPGVQVGKDCGATGLIDDGEDGNNQNLPNDNRGGYWYTFKDKGTTTVEPTAGEEGGTFAMSEGGHDSQYAARYHGTIGTGSVVFSGMGMNFVDPKDAYDASKYAGVSFWAKKGSAESTGKVRLKVPDSNTDPQGGVCTECFNDFGANMVLTTEWKQFSFKWSQMKQLPDWGAPHKPHITQSKIYGLQFQVNIPRSTYDIYIDDVKFICE